MNDDCQMTGSVSSNRLFTFLRSPLFPIFMIVFVDVLGLGITIPVLPLFAKNDLGAEAQQITALTSVFFGAQLLAGPVLGRLSDRFGRRPVLIASQSGTLTALLLTGLASSIGWLYVARLIDGFTGGNISVAQAYLSDITDEKNRARGLGLINAGFSLGFVFGPAFGSVLAAFFGPRVPFFAAACMSFTTILLSLFLLPESLTRERRQREQAAQSANRSNVWAMLRQPSLRLLLFISFGTYLGFFGFQTIYALWLEQGLLAGYSAQVVQQSIGGMLTAVGLFGIATQTWWVGPLVRRFGEKHLVVFGNLARGAWFLLLGLVPHLVTALLSLPFIAVGGGVALPSLIALLTYSAPPGERGRVIGLNQSAAALGSIVGPLVSGWVFTNLTPDTAMAMSGAVTITTIMLGLGLYRLPDHRRAAPQPAQEAS